MRTVYNFQPVANAFDGNDQNRITNLSSDSEPEVEDEKEAQHSDERQIQNHDTLD